jgi:hypothetical protein
MSESGGSRTGDVRHGLEGQPEVPSVGSQARCPASRPSSRVKDQLAAANASEPGRGQRWTLRRHPSTSSSSAGSPTIRLAGSRRPRRPIVRCWRRRRATPTRPQSTRRPRQPRHRPGRLGRIARRRPRACYREALRLRPEFPGALNNLGAALTMLGRPAEAETCFREVVRLRRTFADAHNNLAVALCDLRRHADAQASARAALSLLRGRGELPRGYPPRAGLRRRPQQPQLRPAHHRPLRGGLGGARVALEGQAHGAGRRTSRSRCGAASRSASGPSCCTPNRAWATPCSSAAMRR